MKNPRLHNFTSKREILKKFMEKFNVDVEKIVVHYWDKKRV